MYVNSKNNIWFFSNELACYNMSTVLSLYRIFTVDYKTRRNWTSSTSSTIIAPEILSRWM
jgi:hypothetical protein